MTLKYELLKKGARLIGIKRMTSKSVEEILSHKPRVVIPKIHDKDLMINQIYVNGFLVLTIKQYYKTKANLFIIGGGMVSPPRPDSIRKAVQIAKDTGLDLYVPYYPLCTQYPVDKAYEMIHETYKLMLKEYEAKDISVLGTSSGGNLALGMVAYINANQINIPMPKRIIAISPGTCPSNEEERERMKELDEKDVAISAKYMESAEVIMKHGEDVPDYMLHLQDGDFSNSCQVTFIYGSDEVLYAFAPSFEKAMQKYKVDYDMIVGQGMFHCYPVFPICKEAKEGYDLMIRLLKR